MDSMPDAPSDICRGEPKIFLCYFKLSITLH
jgi:hypothetical protein